jgi:hypothetical protein
MQVEHRIRVATAAETIFRIYQDVPGWSTWDPDTRQATLDGPFEVGSRGKLTPAQGRTVPMLLTEVVPGRSFTVESRIPLFRMVFEHELHPVIDAASPSATPLTEVIHRVTLSGPLMLLLGRMLVRQLNAGLPVTLGRLKVLAEQGAVAPHRA